jgi:hypothetical protein
MLKRKRTTEVVFEVQEGMLRRDRRFAVDELSEQIRDWQKNNDVSFDTGTLAALEYNTKGLFGRTHTRIEYRPSEWSLPLITTAAFEAASKGGSDIQLSFEVPEEEEPVLKHPRPSCCEVHVHGTDVHAAVKYIRSAVESEATPMINSYGIDDTAFFALALVMACEKQKVDLVARIINHHQLPMGVVFYREDPDGDEAFEAVEEGLLEDSPAQVAIATGHPDLVLQLRAALRSDEGDAADGFQDCLTAVIEDEALHGLFDTVLGFHSRLGNILTERYWVRGGPIHMALRKQKFEFISKILRTFTPDHDNWPGWKKASCEKIINATDPLPIVREMGTTPSEIDFIADSAILYAIRKRDHDAVSRLLGKFDGLSAK